MGEDEDEDGAEGDGRGDGTDVRGPIWRETLMPIRAVWVLRGGHGGEPEVWPGNSRDPYLLR